MPRSLQSAVLLAAVLVSSLSNAERAGFNKKPLVATMGWRSWNYFGNAVNQTLLESIMSAVAESRYVPNGPDHVTDQGPISLRDLGYSSVGLDAGWVRCVNGSFHDKDGKPMVNTTAFPDMKAMTDHAHSLNLTAGWYMNPCDCNEHGPDASPHYMEDAAALAAYGYDGLKVDACGVSSNMTAWTEALAATGRPMTAGLENCRNYKGVPELYEGTCPFDWFRSTEDNAPDWLSINEHLQVNAQVPNASSVHGGLPYSRPGCLSYPDMLEVFSGKCEQLPPGTEVCGSNDTYRRVGGLNVEETKAHFGAWAILSSPLILGHNLLDDDAYSRAWPIISNTDIIDVNQAWYGDPGRFVSSSKKLMTNLTTYLGHDCECIRRDPVTLPEWTVWAKTVSADGSKVAVTMINVSNGTLAHGDISLDIHDVSPTFKRTSSWTVYDAWQHKDIAVLPASHQLQNPELAPHTSVFYILTVKEE